MVAPAAVAAHKPRAAPGRVGLSLLLLSPVLLLLLPTVVDGRARGKKKPRYRQAYSHLAAESVARARSASGDAVRELLDESMGHVVAGLAETEDFVLLNLAVTNLFWRGWAADEPGRTAKDRAGYCERARAVFTPAEQVRVTLPEIRYFFTICCDDARRQGGDEARAACFLQAGRAGVWKRKWQYPQILHDGLTARPWWTEGQLEPTGVLDALRSLQQHWQLIRREALASGASSAFRTEPDALYETGTWTELVLQLEGTVSEPACATMPDTCALLATLSQQGLTDAMAGVEKGAVKVSRLSPGTTIKPHCAAVNDRIRVHLALSVPNDADIGIQVAGEERRWEEGQLLVFDDSFEHDVWHRGGTEDRIVLILDLRHPDLPRKN